MASEDSRNRDGLRKFIVCANSCDLIEPVHREVDLLAHQPHDLRKADELVPLRRSQWMCFEKRNNRGDEITEGPDAVAVQVFPVVIVTSVATDVAAFEVPLQLVQDMHAPSSLDHAEVRLNLPTQTTTAIPEYRNTEAAFAVDEADDPLLETWPFLLIGRTGRIVTAHLTHPKEGCDMNEYRRIHGVSSI